MKYTVVWKPDAENDLASLWNGSSEREAIASAADQIDARLSRDPQHQGESRHGSIRILIVPPLAVYFKVSPQDLLVQVASVWLWGGDQP